MSMSDAFRDLGGGSLDDFQPRPRPAETSAPGKPTPAQLERVAAQEGFALQNHAVERKTMRSGRVGSHERAQPMTLRLRVADWNRFSAFCERHGYTVADGFARLVQQTDDQ